MVLVVLAIGVLIFGAYLLTRPKLPAKITLVPPDSIQAAQTIEIPLRVSSSTTINAGEFYFSFPTDLLQVKEIKKDDSFFELWVTDSPSFNNATGELSLAGGLPTPGFTGQDGLVATVVFETKQSGIATIRLDREKSRLLANDGLGTKVEAGFTDVRLEVK